MALRGCVGTGNLGGQSSVFFFLLKSYRFWDKFCIKARLGTIPAQMQSLAKPLRH